MTFRKTLVPALLACAAAALVFPSPALPAATAQTAATPAGTTKWNPWESQRSGVTAALRGIHAVGDGVAWASGEHGTVLRTEDSGFVWQRCKVPPNADTLDFRSIWAWDANSAMVMSSGSGRDSRLYKTTDGCVHWRLIHSNVEADGFWDALVFADAKNGYLLGDPVKGQFVLLRTEDGGERWTSLRTKDLNTGKDQLGAFAASNSALALATSAAVPSLPVPWFGTSGVSGGAGPFVYTGDVSCDPAKTHASRESCVRGVWTFVRNDVPLTGSTNSAGVFSLGLREGQQAGGVIAVAVGGDYARPGADTGTAAFRDPQTGKWAAAVKLPHGYRSAVGWDAEDSAWIAVGPNGSDVSYDDGKTWSALGDDGYNAISLPWVVGPEGRIGKLVALKGK